MKLTQLFLDQLEREAPRTRRALENVPRAKTTGNPTRSRALAASCRPCGVKPSWIALINKNELELSPRPVRGISAAGRDGLVGTLDKAVQDGGRPRENDNDFF